MLASEGGPGVEVAPTGRTTDDLGIRVMSTPREPLALCAM